MNLAPAAHIRSQHRLSLRRLRTEPEQLARHHARLEAALAMPGTEPIQAAVADLLHALPAPPAELGQLLLQLGVPKRLAPFVWRGFVAQLNSQHALPRIHHLATRWSVLTTPSLDIPPRALLCGVDDSHFVVQTAMPALLAGDALETAAFLHHCVSATDTLALMLARRALQQAGKPLGPDWGRAMQALQPTPDSA